jgi:hypothetical protein
LNCEHAQRCVIDLIIEPRTRAMPMYVDSLASVPTRGRYGME